MNDFRIVIPSYKRAKTLRDKTLNYLSSCGVMPELVDVFVADEKELHEYKNTIGSVYNVIMAKPGMRAVRNFIQQYYEEGQKLFCLDDDIEEIVYKVNDKTVCRVDDLISLINDGFDLLKQNKSGLFGINAVLNPFFMDHSVSVNLKYIVGCVWGCINHRDPALAVTLDDKEDFERTIKYYLKYGSVVRMNWYAPKTRYYKEPGGMQVERTTKRVRESAIFLANKYPGLCKLNTGKKSGHFEITLRDTRGKK